MPAGRPSLPYDPELADLICERLSTSEMGLEDILDELRVLRGPEKVTPSLTTIWRWLDSHEDFRQNSARARRFQAQILHDRAQKVAREALIVRTEKTVTTDKGTETHITVGDNVERSKLLVQTLLRRAGQLDSKKFGEKQQVELTGSVDLVARLDAASKRVNRIESHSENRIDVTMDAGESYRQIADYTDSDTI